MLDHKLTIFYHTAKHLNTTKAAEILRLSQPAISKSIKELEKGLGITLFDREKGRLMLTPAGKYLLEQSEELIYNPQIQISAESETKRSIFREKDKTKRSKKESAQHSKSRNKSFVMTSVSAL